MRSSTAQRERVWIGLALAGLLGLGGAFLLILARPIMPPLTRWSDADAVETRRTARETETAPPDAAPASRPQLARLAIPLEADLPVPPGAPDTDRDEAEDAEARPPTPTTPTPAPAPFMADPPPARARVDLGGILRVSGLACLDQRETLLSPDERELCRERLGASTWRAPSLPPTIEGAERAAYDAAARAQAPRRALVPLLARGAGGAFAGEDRGRSGRSPRLGCRIRFGLNADRGPGGAESVHDANPCFAGLR